MNSSPTAPPTGENPNKKRSLGDSSILDGGTFSVESFHDKPFLGSNGAVVIKTVYRLAVKDRQGQTWHTEKRYSDFRSLHEQATSLGLMNDHNDHYSFPSKAWLRSGEIVKEARRENFHDLLQLLWGKNAKGLLFSFLIDWEETGMNSGEATDNLLEDGDYARASGSRLTNTRKEILVEDKTTSRKEEESTSVFQVSAKQIIFVCALTMITSTLFSILVDFLLTKSTYLDEEGRGNLLESSENDDIKADYVTGELGKIVTSNDEIKIQLALLLERLQTSPTNSQVDLPEHLSSAIENEALYSVMTFLTKIAVGTCIVRSGLVPGLAQLRSFKAPLASLLLLWYVERFLLPWKLSSSTSTFYLLTICIHVCTTGCCCVVVSIMIDHLLQSSSRDGGEEYDEEDEGEGESSDMEVTSDGANSSNTCNISLSELKTVHDILIEGITRPSLSVEGLKRVHECITKGGK
ncbi:hypothetical protein TrLO_g12526 [Triparma laevis f. longispina]|uniref:PX domain-containing protein n=1 Tax=Triparma laevis f. longispina TaxID=1714387 RepID=A0A9W7EH14_9STRA|nr:hypothetical protein TrLO_g12526 [Triparma laevis f. longispina]